MPGVYWQDSSRRPDVYWPGRGLAWEVGARVYNGLLMDNRKDEFGGVFPPALVEWERRYE